jgi:hypothetical protein
MPLKTPGGKDLHHCPRHKHANQSGCLRGGCIERCAECAKMTSPFSRRCRWCDTGDNRPPREDRRSKSATPQPDQQPPAE